MPVIPTIHHARSDGFPVQLGCSGRFEQARVAGASAGGGSLPVSHRHRCHCWGSCSSTGRKYLWSGQDTGAKSDTPRAVRSAQLLPHSITGAFRLRHWWFSITGGIRPSIVSVSDFLIIGGFRPQVVVTDRRSYRSHPLSQIVGGFRSSVEYDHGSIPVIGRFRYSSYSDHEQHCALLA